tara:strand:- start:11244 stop:12113 length:870 start_codon:yes stop_codon:yes gene_type:complete
MDNIGLGLFSIPKILENDLEGSIKIMSKIGIREFELYGPYPFSSEIEKESWALVTPKLGFSASGFYNHSPEHFKALLQQYQITAPSMHTDLYTLESNMVELAKASRIMGAKYVVLPFIPESERLDLDSYKKMGERFNEIGRQAKEEGVKFAYHNHGYGLIPEDGVVPLELILKGTDLEIVFFEMDLFWTTAGKANPIELLKRYEGRYKLLHIKDMKKITNFKGKGSTYVEWMELFPLLVPSGEGAIPLKEIIEIAQKTGMEHYFIEQDLAGDPIGDIETSFKYLDGLSF